MVHNFLSNVTNAIEWSVQTTSKQLEQQGCTDPVKYHIILAFSIYHETNINKSIKTCFANIAHAKIMKNKYFPMKTKMICLFSPPPPPPPNPSKKIKK